MVDPPVPPAWDFGVSPTWTLAAPAAGQQLYRVVGRSTPRIRDFQSDRDKERPRFPDQSEMDYLGVSMFETEELAEANAAVYPKLIASVVLFPDRGFTLARTEVDIEGHYSVWGDAGALLESVEGPVRRRDEPG